MLWSHIDFFFFFFTNIRYQNIVQLLIFDTDINGYGYIWLWNEHIMAHLYCDVLLDA